MGRMILTGIAVLAAAIALVLTFVISPVVKAAETDPIFNTSENATTQVASTQTNTASSQSK